MIPTLTECLHKDVNIRSVIMNSLASIGNLAAEIQNCSDMIKDSPGMFCTLDWHM